MRQVKSRKVGVPIVISLVLISGVLLLAGAGKTLRRSEPRLVSIEPLPGGEMCQWIPASAGSSLAAAFAQERAAREAAKGDGSRQEVSRRMPIRMIKDPNSSFSSVAVDAGRNEVIMTDENLFSIMIYDRLENTPPGAKMSEPKRMIHGERTHLEFLCSVYVDPGNGDIYVDNNDSGPMLVFNRNAKGDVAPDRIINTPHTTFGIAVHEESQELMIAIQDDAAIVTYRKQAQGDEGPVRLLQGVRTGMADPHGLTLDKKKDIIYVSNWGSVNVHVAPPGGAKTGTLGRGKGQPNWPIGRNYAIPGSGKISPPSITVYPRTAKGDTPPLRTLQGPKTQFNWPTSLSVNSKTGELFVANDTGHSVLVFDGEAQGDVAPIRVLKGPKTLIQNPTGVFYDEKNDELWVTNFSNHSAVVFKATASGDTPPLRVIRTAPLDAPAPMIGNPNPVTYDSKRDELITAN